MLSGGPSGPHMLCLVLYVLLRLKCFCYDLFAYILQTAGVQCDVNAVKWKLGDMLWAKVSGHPWWPCIVLPDPDQSVWTKPFQSRVLIFQT